MKGYTCGCDATAKNRIGQNADLKTTIKYGQLQRYAGFPVGYTSQPVDNSYLDQDVYTIRQWLGIVGENASTSIIDTSLYGDITIELTLAPAEVLMLSPPVGSLTAYASVTNTGYYSRFRCSSNCSHWNWLYFGYCWLSNCSLRYASTIFDAVASVLQGGAVFKLYCPNYSTFLGAGVTLPRTMTTLSIYLLNH